MNNAIPEYTTVSLVKEKEENNIQNAHYKTFPEVLIKIIIVILCLIICLLEHVSLATC